MKRLFDIVASGLGLIVLSPLFAVLAVWIKADSKGPVFYRQTRVGRNNRDFRLFKFRSMRPDSDKLGLITVGGHDPRVTRSGYYIRKYKLDEFPQLINVFKGDMSLVGPRPEVRNVHAGTDARALGTSGHNVAGVDTIPQRERHLGGIRQPGPLLH